MNNSFNSPEENRFRELKRRKQIVVKLQNLPVTEGSKAYDIIWEAVEIVQAYDVELATAAKRNNVLKERLVELEARLDCYFGVEVRK